MTASGPTEQYEYDATQQHWEQPRFGTSEPAVSGAVLPAGAWTARSAAAAVVPPSVEEDRLRMIVRLIWPVAIVLAITTGHWVPLLVAAIIVGGILRRRLLRLRYQRLTYQQLAVAPSLR
jgi:hypothetical protein